MMKYDTMRLSAFVGFIVFQRIYARHCSAPIGARNERTRNMFRINEMVRMSIPGGRPMAAPTLGK